MVVMIPTNAYTYKGARTVFICKAFWDAPDTGVASRAGTLVLERSQCFGANRR